MFGQQQTVNYGVVSLERQPAPRKSAFRVPPTSSDGGLLVSLSRMNVKSRFVSVRILGCTGSSGSAYPDVARVSFVLAVLIVAVVGHLIVPLTLASAPSREHDAYAKPRHGAPTNDARSDARPGLGRPKSQLENA